MIKRRLSQFVVLFAVLLAIVPAQGQGGEDDVIQYGKDCARFIADVPPFNCLNGEIIKVTVDGKEPSQYTANMSCDRPAYLPYPKSSDGACTPYSRVQTIRDDDIQILT